MALRKNLRSAAAAGVIVLALVGAGCSSSSDPNTWEQADETGKIEENFLRACAEADDGATADADALEAYCQCSYDDLREEYDDDFDGFVAVNSDLGSEPTAIPPNVSAIIVACAATHLAT
ncbi:MAG: hypothetical protein RIB98_09465 [Acidimicrobiales bacterium]